MSYTQIQLGPLKDGVPGSNTRGLKFNQLAIELFSQLRGEGTTTMYYAAIYGGMRGNTYAKREEPDYTFGDVIDWIDAMPKEVKIPLIESVFNCLNETQLWKDLIEEGSKAIADEEKKTQAQDTPPLETSVSQPVS